MKILPAIDLRGGKVVRLQQGKADQQTTYSDDPIAVAKGWEQQGAEELHIVDLDGAFTGHPQNLHIVEQIAKAINIPIELGGGMRNEEAIDAALAAGVARVVIGTKACDSLDFVRSVVDKFGGESIAVGIDAKNGIVAVKGWTEASKWTAVQLAQAVSVTGAGTIIYTDISTDGMFTGPNIPALKEVLESVDLQVIASGGVATVEHINVLRQIPNLYGAIVGKALYDKKVTLAEIL
ncbi:MAG: 1-(5-phosphoribosyl)-5-[(5-phosphoribosylamino)methylideneamino]imidazole-4-carboxamide isomerase [Verrucomicrobia bacterium Tous-C9LFEB]|nr:MAG: 1-(5-phosphoribosyl)-5-[(5-phosphoribosylamino)methylideneamino]imidazole-4-carboxamide isomerase [Verrucomicrobia bacterium Tous-C9LFEB]